MKNPFNISELSLSDMRNLSLVDTNGDYTIEREDLDALLAGRLTKLLRLNNLGTNDFQIDQLDAKVSLYRGTDGKAGFRLHPIYKEPVIPNLLDEDEAEALISGKRSSIDKIISVPGKKELVFEYDPDTRSFVSYDPGNIIAPDKINGYQLNDGQKDEFKKGRTVELPDGTKVQHRATDPKGLWADRAALILSVMIDGGISYLMFRGIRHLMNSDKQQVSEPSPSFVKAYQEMESYFANRKTVTNEQSEETRGYTKTRAR